MVSTKNSLIWTLANYQCPDFDIFCARNSVRKQCPGIVSGLCQKTLLIQRLQGYSGLQRRSEQWARRNPSISSSSTSIVVVWEQCSSSGSRVAVQQQYSSSMVVVQQWYCSIVVVQQQYSNIEVVVEQQYSSIVVQQYSCIVVQLYSCIVVQLYSCYSITVV